MIQAGDSFANKRTGETMTVLQTSADTDGKLFAFDNMTPAGTAGPPLHIHPVQEERFIVIAGTLLAQMNGEYYQFQAGEMLVVPAGAIHTYDNKLGEAVTFRVELRPALDSEQLFAGLFSLSSQKPMIAALQFAQLMHHCQSRFYIAKMPRLLQKVLFGGLVGLGRLSSQQS